MGSGLGSDSGIVRADSGLVSGSGLPSGSVVCFSSPQRFICVLILLNMCPHIAIYVSS